MNSSFGWHYPTIGPFALSRDDLRRNAPSVFAESARPGVSSRYSFVSTADVVDLLDDEGWVPVRVKEQRVRLPSRQGFQMHEVRFARRDDLLCKAFDLGTARPEMILQNAHDGSRAYRIDAGLYRLVCRNGLVVADSLFAQVSIRHVDVLPEEFAEAARGVATGTPAVMDAVRRWMGSPMAEAKRVEFARRALGLRWGTSEPIGQLVNPTQLLTPLRFGDQATDLWTTFNVIQEHLMRGGDRYSGTVAGVAGSRYLRNRTKPLGGLQEGHRLNKALWALAEEFSRN